MKGSIFELRLFSPGNCVSFRQLWSGPIGWKKTSEWACATATTTTAATQTVQFQNRLSLSLFHLLFRHRSWLAFSFSLSLSTSIEEENGKTWLRRRRKKVKHTFQIFFLWLFDSSKKKKKDFVKELKLGIFLLSRKGWRCERAGPRPRRRRRRWCCCDRVWPFKTVFSNDGWHSNLKKGNGVSNGWTADDRPKAYVGG